MQQSVNVMSNTCAFPPMTSQTVFCERDLCLRYKARFGVKEPTVLSFRRCAATSLMCFYGTSEALQKLKKKNLTLV